MRAYHEPSVDELRRESERTRAALSNTVNELRDKMGDTATEIKTLVSPAHIKKEVTDYVRESGEKFVDTVERKVRENPLQAVAIGAGLAYPLWGIIRMVPTPLLLIGAGVWFAKHGNAQLAAAKAEDLANSAKEHASKLYSSAQEQASNLISSTQETAVQGARRVGDAVADAGAAVADAGASVSSSLSTAAQRVFGATAQARSSIAGASEDVSDSIHSTVTSLKDSTVSSVSRAKEGAANAAESSRNAFVDIVERNPLLVAGVGLALGAFLAGSLPPSNAENKVFGERSDDLKDKAREAATQGLDRAKRVAADMVGDVAAAAAREGLSTEGIENAVKGIASGVKAVAQRGVQTALEGDKASLAGNTTQQFKS